ncbi:hypothetical protein [Paenibacillus sp. MBLB4367]|uniref:hypothetical protein n=1 Tax=Paenibacillus sp. MBLB4367 TaxID=3384767 RepID=UPI003908000B
MKRIHQLNNGISPAEQLHEALKKRGFLSSVDGDLVLVSGGNGCNDYSDLRQFLEGNGIPACYSGEQVQILCPVLPGTYMAKLSALPVRYSRPNIPNGFHSWRAFTKRNHGVKWNTLSLDRGIAYLVKTMSEAGILVTGGCDGHGRQEPRVYFASAYAAAWFDVIRRNSFAEFKLNYRWEVVEGSDNTSPRLQAVREQDSPWSMRMIREDAMTLGDWLRKDADRLRRARRETFKNRSMKLDAERMSASFTGLCSWMENMTNPRERDSNEQSDCNGREHEGSYEGAV